MPVPLTVRDLTIARGGVPVLAGLTLSVDPGRALILRGPNGIGKTTLLRTLAGLQPPLAGTISLNPDQIAYAAHADGVKAVLTVSENLGFWAAVHGSRPIDAALATMDLAGLAHRPAHSLSAGQKRRLGLARLLIARRPVWLLDEPTVSLDTASTALFAKIVATHLAGGGIALIATHIDLGLPDTDTLELTPFRATATSASGAFDEAFT